MSNKYFSRFMAYFEQLFYIYNKDNKEVGMCFVELLPGVYNKKIRWKIVTKENLKNNL